MLFLFGKAVLWKKLLVALIECFKWEVNFVMSCGMTMWFVAIVDVAEVAEVFDVIDYVIELKVAEEYWKKPVQDLKVPFSSWMFKIELNIVFVFDLDSFFVFCILLK